MPDRTPNHDLPLPDPGSYQGSWGTDILNDDLTQKLEERVPIRDDEANLDTYTPHIGARFEALDTETVYVGDGTSWVLWTSTGQNPTYGTATADTFDGGTHAFDIFQDHGRFQMLHLNTWNWGGNSKVTEATHTISDFTDKPIYKVLLIAEHISVYSSTASDQTFALQINGQNTDWENRRIDGSYTVGDPHAIVTKGAANQAPWLGQIWIHVDQDIRVRPDGSVRGEGPADSHVEFAAHDSAQTERPFTVDSIRYFTPDGDEIRMRRATMFGFTPDVNE